MSFFHSFLSINLLTYLLTYLLSFFFYISYLPNLIFSSVTYVLTYLLNYRIFPQFRTLFSYLHTEVLQASYPDHFLSISLSIYLIILSPWKIYSFIVFINILTIALKIFYSSTEVLFDSNLRSHFFCFLNMENVLFYYILYIYFSFF